MPFKIPCATSPEYPNLVRDWHGSKSNRHPLKMPLKNVEGSEARPCRHGPLRAQLRSHPDFPRRGSELPPEIERTPRVKTGRRKSTEAGACCTDVARLRDLGHGSPLPGPQLSPLYRGCSRRPPLLSLVRVFLLKFSLPVQQLKHVRTMMRLGVFWGTGGLNFSCSSGPSRLSSWWTAPSPSLTFNLSFIEGESRPFFILIIRDNVCEIGAHSRCSMMVSILLHYWFFLLSLLIRGYTGWAFARGWAGGAHKLTGIR